MSYVVDNPWKLTPGQCQALAAVVEAGCDKLAAAALGLSAKTISVQILRAKARMGLRTRLQCFLVWDRFQRDEKRTTR